MGMKQVNHRNIVIFCSATHGNDEGIRGKVNLEFYAISEEEASGKNV